MELRDRTAAVTGASGFLGGHVVRRLAEAQGMRVRALVREVASPGVASLVRHGVEIVRGDVLDPGSLAAALRGAELVVHAAASRPGSRRSTTRSTIVDGTRNALLAAEVGGARRFVHLSTFDVYFGDPGGPASEDAALRPHGNLYGDAKIAAEEALRARPPGRAPSVVILRLPLVYGPGGRYWVADLVEDLRRGRLFLPGGGEFALPYLYVDNAVDAIVAAARAEGAAGVYNVLDGRVPFREFVAPLARLAGRAPRTMPFWMASLGGLLADIGSRATGRWYLFSGAAVRMMRSRSRDPATAEKARRELGWEPRVAPAEGMRRTCAWLARTAEGGPACPTPRA